jgi:chromosome segregation ATPase
MFTPELIIGLFATVVLGVLGTLVSFAFKRAWINLMELHAKLRKALDPETGIQADIKATNDRIDEVHGEMEHITTEMEHLRRNGHAFADRVNTIENRQNNGAVELDGLRQRLMRVESHAP